MFHIIGINKQLWCFYSVLYRTAKLHIYHWTPNAVFNSQKSVLLYELQTYMTYLLPDFITPNFLLKTQGKIVVVCFGPNDQSILWDNHKKFRFTFVVFGVNNSSNFKPVVFDRPCEVEFWTPIASCLQKINDDTLSVATDTFTLFYFTAMRCEIVSNYRLLLIELEEPFLGAVPRTMRKRIQYRGRPIVDPRSSHTTSHDAWYSPWCLGTMPRSRSSL